MSSSPLRTFGPYTILEDLAQGGMGIVHVARRYGSSHPCVLKKPLAALAEHPELLRRFRREANLCTQLEHDNIARVLDAGTEDDSFYIAFELIVGQSLSRILKRISAVGKWVSTTTAVWIVDEILRGLEYAHDAVGPDEKPLSIVHRDLSPSNVMISYAGAIKIIDFGVAIGKVDEFQTNPGRFVGTPRYMSPEQAMSQAIDRRADLYTVGVLFWELMARRRLVPKGTLKEVLGAVAARPAPTLDAVSDAIGTIAKRALSKNVDERYQTATEMRAALHGAVPEVADGAAAELRDLLRRFYAPERDDARRLAEMAAELAKTDLVEAAQTARTSLELSPRDDLDFVTDAALIAPTATAAPALLEAPTELVAPMAITPPEAATLDTLDTLHEPASRATKPAAPPPGRRRTLYLGVAVVGAAALAAVTIVDRSTRRETPTRIAPLPPPPRTTPEVRARTEPSRTEQKVPAETAAPTRRARTTTADRPKKRATPSDEQGARAPQLEAIAQRLERLDTDPENAALLVETHDAIEALITRLPANERAAVRAQLARALRAGDHRLLRKSFLRISP